MLSSSVLLWLAVGLLAFWSVGAYNRLVRLRSTALQAFGALDAQLLGHAGLVETAVAESESRVAADAGVDPVSAPVAVPEALAALQAASSQFASSLSAARARPLDREAMAALAAARDVLAMAWQNSQTAALPAEGIEPEGLRARWEQWTRQSQKACTQFNEAVGLHNAAVSQFPALLLAKLFGFKIAGTL